MSRPQVKLKTAQSRTDDAYGSADTAKPNKILWGHPLPTWGDAGLDFVPGSWWQDSAYSDLVEWMGRCRDQLKKICAHDDYVRDCAWNEITSKDEAKQRLGGMPMSPHQLETEITDLTVLRERARDQLWRMAVNKGVSFTKADALKTPWESLANFAGDRAHILRRMSRVSGLLPRRPRDICPPPMAKESTPDRISRMQSAPQEHEDAYA